MYVLCNITNMNLIAQNMLANNAFLSIFYPKKSTYSEMKSDFSSELRLVSVFQPVFYGTTSLNYLSSAAVTRGDLHCFRALDVGT